jgi:hypothetical protein
VELLHRARQAGYTSGKSAIYALAQTLRHCVVTPLVRFEGLPGEFSQHGAARREPAPPLLVWQYSQLPGHLYTCRERWVQDGHSNRAHRSDDNAEYVEVKQDP